jgi:hypothetical protein
VDVDKRGAEWRSSGWTRFDENAEPYTGVTSADEEWRESSKVGTVGGGVAGAATGAVLGAVRDIAGEKAEDCLRRYDSDYRTHYQTYGAVTHSPYTAGLPLHR